jgi:AcrR family transcriptional regulator
LIYLQKTDEKVTLDNLSATSTAPGQQPEKDTRRPLSLAKDVDLIEKKHRQIIDGACSKFFQKGYHKTTIREIAVASGMSMGQLYHYISSKDDVLFLIYKHMQMVWYNHLVESGVEEIEDPMERLNKALRYTLEFMVANKELILFIYTETKYLDKKYLRVVLEMDDKTVVGFWRHLLKEADLKLPRDSSHDFYANFISYLMVFLPLRGWNLAEKPNQGHINFLIDFILRGLGQTE